MLPINKTYIVNKDTTDYNNNQTIKKGTIVKGLFSGTMPNGEIRITTDKGQIIKYSDLQEQTNNIATDWTKGFDYYNDWNYGIPKNYVKINQPKPSDPQVLLKAQEELQKAQLDKLNSAQAQAQVQSKTMTKMNIGLFVGGVVVGYFLLKMIKK